MIPTHCFQKYLHDWDLTIRVSPSLVHLHSKKLAKQLGLNSVEELEDAIDAMEGFDTDGGAFDTSDVREARVRSAYIDWCKSYDKSVDESRFPTFSSNFLAMEEYSKENGREMVLNKYADCTEEEYRELTAPAAPTIQEMKAEAKMVETPKAVVEPPKAVKAVAPVVEVEKKVEVENVKVVPSPVPAPMVEAVKPVIKVEATPKLPPKPQPVIAPVIELSLEEQAIADARAMREKEDLQVAKRRARDEAAAEMERQKAIEAMKKQERYASTIIAPKPSKVEAVKKAVTPVVTKKEESVVKKTQASPFASIFGGAKPVEKVVPAKSVVEKKSQVTPIIKSVAAKKVEPKADIFASIFGNAQAKPVSTKAPPVKPVEVTKAAAKPVQKKGASSKCSHDFIDYIILAHIFRYFQHHQYLFLRLCLTFIKPHRHLTNQCKRKVIRPSDHMTSLIILFLLIYFLVIKSPVSVPPAVLNFYQASSAPKKTQPKSVPEIQKSIVEKKSQPKSQPFNFFQSAAPKPAPLPEPVVVEKKTPPKSQTFSFFQSAAPKPAPKVAPKPAPVPPARKSPTLSLFAAKTPFTPAQMEVVVEKKTPPKSDPFSFFQTAAPKAAPQTVVKPSPVSARKSPTLSLFNAKTPASPPPKASAVEAKQNARGSPTFSLFGGTKAVAPTAQPVIVEQKKAVQKTGSFSLFGATKPSGGTISIQKKAVPAAKQTMFAPKKSAPVVDNIPIIGKFKQNADGSITGVVRNSKSFRTGTEITTSPVPRGAKAGSIVTTSSGSKYRLE